MRLSFSKKQRLKRKKWIQKLFKEGFLAHRGPILAYALPEGELSNHQVLISVPKRYLKKAVDRNLVKRRMREVYRKNQTILTPKEAKEHLLLAYVYRGTTQKDTQYTEVEKAMLALMMLAKKRHIKPEEG